MVDIGYGVYYIYVNKYFERVFEEERIKYKKEKVKFECKRLYYQKMNNYVKFVKEMYWFDVSLFK